MFILLNWYLNNEDTSEGTDEIVVHTDEIRLIQPTINEEGNIDGSCVTLLSGNEIYVKEVPRTIYTLLKNKGVNNG